MARRDDDYRKMLVALMDSKAVVLSILNQLGLEKNVDKEQLQQIIRQGALAIVDKSIRPLPPEPRRIHRRKLNARGR